jgi:hypothetical protein
MPPGAGPRASGNRGWAAVLMPANVLKDVGDDGMAGPTIQPMRVFGSVMVVLAASSMLGAQGPETGCSISPTPRRPEGPDGALYVMTDGNDGKILRLAAKGAAR